ncbi:MAG: carotenoid biosynthesis protein [Gammaproteobacteria bacterium]|nr:carotenoid biosynthesis protein [Gammaproteobacteria bacterium]
MEALFWSLIHRPYVTLFMIFFLALSIIEQGRARTLLWVISSYLIALLAEWGSIHHGIPFGDYAYHYEALQNDLVIAGVPFFDTISFSFLSYVSFSFGQFLLAPLKRRGLDIQRAANFKQRYTLASLLLGAHYPKPGIHFGVTFANYCGWFIVALATLAANGWLDRWWGRQESTPFKAPPLKGSGLFAPLFWFGIVGFQLGITYWIALNPPQGLDIDKTLLQAVTGSYLLAPLLVWTLVHIQRPADPHR